MPRPPQARIRPPLRVALVAVAVALAGCASAGGRVELVHYEGLVTTHFGGIPDESRICARIHNARSQPVEWVRLRLVSESRLGARPARFTSQWLYRGRVEPGESVALELPDAPVADRIELRVRRAGRGRASRGAREARPTDSCTELWAEQILAEATGARPDADVGGLATARPGEPDVELTTDPLIASEE